MLIKRNKIWHYQIKIHGRTWKRTTGETDKRKAQEKVPELHRLALLHAQQPQSSPRLYQAIVREIARVESDIGSGQAKRIAYCLQAFATWIGADVPLESVTTPMLHNYQRRRLRTRSADTVRHEVSALCRMLRENGFEPRRPPAIHGRKTPNRAFTDAELDSLFAVVTPRYRALYAVLLFTGARLAEIVPSNRSAHTPFLKSEVEIQPESASDAVSSTQSSVLSPQSCILTIRTSKCKPGETSLVRTVPVPEAVTALLQGEMALAPGPYAFRPLNKPARDFDACLERAGIAKVDVLGRKLTLHSFRHTYATLAAQFVGGNQFLLQRMLGHKRLETTAQYCHTESPQFMPQVGFLTDHPQKGSQTGSQIIELDFQKEDKSKAISGGWDRT